MSYDDTSRDYDGEDSPYNSDEELKKEIAHMKKIIKSNPFSTRSAILCLFDDPENASFYDEKTHDLAAEVYETLHDKTSCVLIGKLLAEHGGLECMQAAYYAVKMHIADANILQCYWDGIGGWVW
jgi:hypothetical protein